MAPRRGGSGGAGMEVALGGSVRGGLAPPPLRRMQPWQQDGSTQCDIVAGGVDASGVFKGIYVNGVHLSALLRTFQLSKVFMPVETSTPVQALGQSLQDGIPLVIVTRGCFGREMDYGSGPSRNQIQTAVWDAARKMRADMPQVLVTCIDVPVDAGPEVVNACLQTPLNEYRELMYHDGTWYTPAVHDAAKLGQFMANNEREVKSKGSINFARKRFEWNSKPYENMYTLGWKPVLEVRAPAPVPTRNDLVFTGDSKPKALALIPKSGPSSAESTFQKMLEKARESGDELKGDPKHMLEAVKFYLPRAAPRETTSIKEAIQVLDECAEVLDAEEKFMAKLLVVGAKLTLNEVDEALKVAQSLKPSAPSPQTALEALSRELDCLLELGEVEKALEAARASQATLVASGGHVASGAWNLLARALEAKGEEVEAAEARRSAEAATSKASAIMNGP